MDWAKTKTGIGKQWASTDWEYGGTEFADTPWFSSGAGMDTDGYGPKTRKAM
jgi:hypothetical protein